jgi:outer membrane protein OmpA-like peptidoglycan-associated protein
MKKILFFALLLITQISFAHTTIPSDTLKTPEQKDLQKKQTRLANKSAAATFNQKADKQYRFKSYLVAADTYQSETIADNNSAIQARVAESYRLNAEYEASEYWYSKTVKNSTRAKDYLRYAQVLLINGDCEKAEMMYAKYAAMTPDNPVKLATCSQLRTIPDNRTVEVKNMVGINTKDSEFSAVPFEDGICFTGNRRNNMISKREDKWTKKSFTDLYFASLDAEGVPTSMNSASGAINGKYHDGTAVFDVTKTKMYFAKNNPRPSKLDRNRDLDLYTSVKQNDGTWARGKKMNLNIDDYSTCHPTISADQTTLYFASDRPGGAGGMDIWKSELKNGEWQSPVNLGGTINTKGNEVFPFMAADGVLFFSSDSHASMGGLDVFQTENNEGWSAPQNLGKPYNSPKDDFAFYTKKDNESGWFASNRDGGMGGDDLYTWSGELKNMLPVAVMRTICLTDGTSQKFIPAGKIRMTVIPIDNSNLNASMKNDKGGVIAGECGNMILSLKPTKGNVNEFVLSLENAEGVAAQNEIINENFLTDAKGEISYPVMEGMKYQMVINKNGYESKTVTITAADMVGNDNYCVPLTKLKKPVPALPVVKPAPKPPVVKPAPPVVRKNTATSTTPNVIFNDGINKRNLKKFFLGDENGTFYKGQIIKLTNLYYDFNKATIRSSAQVELDYVYQLLTTYPSLELNLLSHTDARGTDSYNQNLSAGRAVEAMSYLLSKGIPSSRLSARGLGETSLTNACGNGMKCSDEEHQLNRRTEIEVRDFSEDGVIIKD